MITQFKMFEKISMPPKIGDYVIINDELYKNGNLEFYNFIKSNIGKVIDTKISNGNSLTGFSKEEIMLILFENIPDELSYYKKNFFYKDNTRACSVSSLKYWSENKKELETLLASEKYNL